MDSNMSISAIRTVPDLDNVLLSLKEREKLWYKMRGSRFSQDLATLSAGLDSELIVDIITNGRLSGDMARIAAADNIDRTISSIADAFPYLAIFSSLYSTNKEGPLSSKISDDDDDILKKLVENPLTTPIITANASNLLLTTPYSVDTNDADRAVITGSDTGYVVTGDILPGMKVIKVDNVGDRVFYTILYATALSGVTSGTTIGLNTNIINLSMGWGTSNKGTMMRVTIHKNGNSLTSSLPVLFNKPTVSGSTYNTYVSYGGDLESVAGVTVSSSLEPQYSVNLDVDSNTSASVILFPAESLVFKIARLHPKTVVAGSALNSATCWAVLKISIDQVLVNDTEIAGNTGNSTVSGTYAALCASNDVSLRDLNAIDSALSGYFNVARTYYDYLIDTGKQVSIPAEIKALVLRDIRGNTSTTQDNTPYHAIFTPSYWFTNGLVVKKSAKQIVWPKLIEMIYAYNKAAAEVGI